MLFLRTWGRWNLIAGARFNYAAADAKRRLSILHQAGQPLDHPVAIGFPEGRYLKFMLMQARL